MALEDIVQQALINRREYQTQKETLYRAALTLSLERYDYELKFATTGNGTALDYTHLQNDNGGVDTLRIPSVITLNKMMATGGNLVTRFANTVLLTFNGTNGFAADVGSEFLFDFSQTIFQRDILLESLTQSERNVVYAARTFARVRKELFTDLTNQYYNLLLRYRRIDIASQDYFSNLRSFEQGEAEYHAGRLPRFQVDQFEQSTLTSRRQLIEFCTNLELALDQLKLSIGLPPELPGEPEPDRAGAADAPRRTDRSGGASPACART